MSVGHYHCRIGSVLNNLTQTNDIALSNHSQLGEAGVSLYLPNEVRKEIFLVHFGIIGRVTHSFLDAGRAKLGDRVLHRADRNKWVLFLELVEPRHLRVLHLV